MCVHVSGPVLLCKQRPSPATIAGNPACSLQRLSDTRACQAALEARRDSSSWTAETWEAPTPVSSSPTSWLRVKGQVPHMQDLGAKTPSCSWCFPSQSARPKLLVLLSTAQHSPLVRHQPSLFPSLCFCTTLILHHEDSLLLSPVKHKVCSVILDPSRHHTEQAWDAPHGRGMGQGVGT